MLEVRIDTKTKLFLFQCARMQHITLQGVCGFYNNMSCFVPNVFKQTVTLEIKAVDQLSLPLPQCREPLNEKARKIDQNYDYLYG